MDGLDVRLEGLTILVDPPDTELDVVFVHGFTGHPRRTWTYTGEALQRDDKTRGDDVCEPPSKILRFLGGESSRTTSRREVIYWPQDILPATLINTRIMTYGYDSNIRHRLGAPASKSTVYDLGYELLVNLEAKRRSGPDRPLIFVAHSLGGILVKEALRRGEGCRKHHNHLYSIYDATAGLVCFGTPHCGADPRGLVHRVAERVLRVAGLTVNDQLLDSLLPSSERLRELRDEFSRMSREKNWVLYSFQEQYGLKILNGDKVVDDASSTFGDPTLEIVQHVANNHMDICRFKGFADSEYEKVDAAFSHICKVKGIKATVKKSIQLEEPVNDEERRECAKSLIFHQIDSRLLNIKNAHVKTCDWLFEQPEYKNWIHTSLSSDYNGFLWIKGKPAAGKSTIMKHALHQAKMTMPNASVISFFFNARGSILERSTLGMYRSLLLQLMGIPVLQDSIARIFKKNRDRKVTSEWSINELQDAFLSAVQSLQKRRLICFIDALDECAEKEVRAMIEFLEDLGEVAISSGGFLNICLSSRHYPHITIRKAIQLTIERQDGHVTDITTYVKSKFNAPSSLQTDEIKAEILKRASGVFLWVVLVVQMLNKAYDHGQVHAMRRRLNEIPDELDDLFADILTRDAESRDESILCLQWLLFAQRPLKREELYFAVLLGTDLTESVKWDQSEISRETIDRFIISCSKGLAEVSRAKDETVQFIHESVRDFFIYRNGLAKLHVNNALDITGLSHNRLAECCDHYINEVIRRLLVGGPLFPRKIHQEACSGSFPFLQYAVLNLFRHSDIAEGCGIPQKDFLKKFRGGDMSNAITWKNFHDVFRTGDASYGLTTELLYILSDHNLPNLVRVLLDDGVDADAHGKLYGTAIQAAAAHGSQEVCELLLAAGANVNITGGKYSHTLAAAVASHNEDIVMMLKDKDVKTEQKILDYALCEATSWGNVPSMEFLLDLGANPNTKHRNSYSYNETVLEIAIKMDHEAAVQLLLRKGVDKSSLSSEILRVRNDGILVQLLDLGVDQFAVDSQGWTALSIATAFNWEAVVQVLLERPGADPVLMARDIQSSLFYAKQNKNDRILQLFEEAEARVAESTIPAK